MARKQQRKKTKSQSKQKKTGRPKKSKSKYSRGKKSERVSKKSYVGVVQKHPHGFAFLIPQDSTVDDAYVSKKEASGLYSGDTVEYTVSARRGKIFGKIIKVIKRTDQFFFGRIQEVNHRFVLSTYETDLPIKKGGEKKQPWRLGDWAVGRLEEKKGKSKDHLVIHKSFGREMTPDFDLYYVLSKVYFPTEFSKNTVKEAKKFRQEEIDNSKRKDLTQLPFVTIDGEDARDYDDAICIIKKDKGYVIYVAIADVSYYVKQGSHLDKEAKLRSTSVYFPGFCVPMLPFELSHDICSLVPGVARFAMVAEMEVDEHGDVIRDDFYEAKIKNHERLTYTKTFEFYQKKEAHDFSEEVRQNLSASFQVFELLRKRREERGVLDFDLGENKIHVDQSGFPSEILSVERNEAHKMIEEFMVLANSRVAKFMREKELAALYRVHESPDPEKIHNLNDLVSLYQLGKPVDDLSHESLRAVMNRAQQQNLGPLIHRFVLRLQKQAKYHHEPEGHFGLALSDYLHFTSPIRRYPDLVVHRSLRTYLKKDYDAESENVEAMGLSTSTAERNAVDAERWMLKRKYCWFMKEKLNDPAGDAVVTSVLDDKLFIEMLPWSIEAEIDPDQLRADFKYSYDSQEYFCHRDRKYYRVGDQLRVQVSYIDMHLSKIFVEVVFR